MLNKENNYELIKFEDGEISLDVTVSPDEDTVWLTQEEMADLFDVNIPAINKHVINVIKNGELDESTISFLEKVQIEGDRRVTRKIKIYNLDMIISVGYRVNSKRGIMFRKWANSILKEYLLKGHVINEQRCLSCTSNILSLQDNYKKLENRINNLEESIFSSESIFYEGEILESYTFLRKLFFLAKKEIIIIDNYADKFLLSMLKDIKVDIKIITTSNSYLNKEIIPNNINIIIDDNMHDRFIFIDDIAYVIGTSVNSIGKGGFVMIKLKTLNKDKILK